MITDMIGKKVVVRGCNSGVFYGTLAEKEGSEVKLNNGIRLWYWKGAATISQIAEEGVKEPDECKFAVAVDEIVILDAIEIVLCTDEAAKNMEEVRPWRV